MKRSKKTAMVSLEEMRKLHAEGKTNREIARLVRTSPANVSYHFQRLGIKANGNPPLVSLEEKDLMLRLHGQGLNCHAIGRELKRSHQAVRRVLAENGLKSNRKRGVSLSRIADRKARCSECGAEKAIKKFSLHRRATGSYRESYCDDCRRGKRIARINADATRFVSLAYSSLRDRCRKQKLKFQLSREYLLSLYEQQNGLCFYTDCTMRCMIGNGPSRDSLSVDRVVPGLGYVEGNIVLCTRLANSVKTDLTLGELKMWLPGWHQRLADSGFITY